MLSEYDLFQFFPLDTLDDVCTKCGFFNDEGEGDIFWVSGTEYSDSDTILMEANFVLNLWLSWPLFLHASHQRIQ